MSDIKLRTRAETLDRIRISLLNEIQEMLIVERYFSRQALTDTKVMPHLGKVQKELETKRDYLKFIEEISKEK